MKHTDGSGRVLVDVDGTLCKNLPRICEFVEEEYSLSVSPEEVTAWSYTFEPIDTGIGEIADYLLTERPEWYLADLEPVEGASEGVRRLAEAGFEVSIVTHRHPETHDVTRRWLAENGITYAEFVEEVPEIKADVAGDVLVDDHQFQVRRAAETGTVGIMLNQPYNEPVDHRRAHMLDSWREIVELLVDDA